MADISKITPPGSQTTYNLKDATAREQANWNTNNGVKNAAPVNSASKTNSGYFFINKLGWEIKANEEYYIEFDFEKTAGDATVQLTSESGNVISSTYTACGSSSSGHAKRKITPNVDAYGYNAYFNTTGTVTISNLMIYPAFIEDNTFEPYALPNTKITPELIELVDSGAKNILNTQGATISLASGVTITRNSDGTFNISRSTSGSVSNNYVLVYINAGAYMLSGAPAGGSSEQWIMDIRTNESQPIVVGEQDTGNGAKVTIPTSDYYRLTFRLGSSYSGTQLFKPMLCSKAAWDVSQKFVPYRPTYEETVEQVAYLQNENRNKLPYTLDSLKALNTSGTWTNNYYVISNVKFTVNKDMTISVALTSGTAPTGTNTFYLCPIADLKLDSNSYMGYSRYLNHNADYSTTNYFGLYGGAGIANLILNSGVDIPSDYASKYTHAIIRISAALSPQFQLWKPMIVDKSIYTAGITEYTPYVLSNAELTAKEQVNENNILTAYGGIVAKNILNYDLSTIKTLNTSGTWANNVYTIGGVTCTVNSDNTITINGDNTGGSTIYFVICDMSTITYTTDYLRQCTMSSDSISQARMTITNLQNIEIADTANGTPLSNFTTSGSVSRVRVVINNEFNAPVTIKPMICNTDIFAISSSYQPYVYDSITLSNYIRQFNQ